MNKKKSNHFFRIFDLLLYIIQYSIVISIHTYLEYKVTTEYIFILNYDMTINKLVFMSM